MRTRSPLGEPGLISAETFLNRSAPVELGDFRVGRALCGPAWSLTPHVHEHHEFHLIVEGTCIHTVNAESYCLRAGDLCVTKAGEVHEMTGDGVSNCRLYYLQLSELTPAEVENLLRCSSARFLSECADLEPLLDRVCRECAQPGVAWRSLVHAMTSVLVVEIGRRIANAPHSIAAERDWENDIVGKAKWVIANSCRHGLTVGELAVAVGMSESGLAHRFAKETGEPVHAYVRRILMLQAQRLLEETHMTVTEIADMLGFPGAHYFCRAFKKHVGSTPTDYRCSFRNL